MSDSDNTDYLLLIPPNFFWVPSDNEEQYARPTSSLVDRELVDGLLSHVSNLENRVTAIESFENSLAADLEILTDFSTRSLTLISKKRNNHQEVLKWVSSNDFGRNHEDGNGYFPNETVHDSHLSLKRSEIAYPPKSPTSVVMSSPLKDRRGDVSNRQTPQKKLELTEVDRLLREMEVTQRDIENKLRFREQDYGLSGSGDHSQNIAKSQGPALLGDNVGSVPDLGFGVRNLFSDSPKQNPTKSPIQTDSNPGIEEPFTKKSVSLLGASNDDSDKWKTYFSHDYNPEAIKTLETVKTPDKSNFVHSARRKLPLSNPDLAHRLENSTYSEKLASPLKSVSSSPMKLESRLSERLNSAVKSGLVAPSESSYSVRTSASAVDKGAGGNGTETNYEHTLHQRAKQYPSNLPGVSEKLLSLNELWKGDDEITLRNPIKLKQKLEEEKYRRLHLENTVQTLQRKVLEEQEKLAVAIQVDEKKDLVIEKVTDAWKKMVDHWKQIEEQRHAASQALLTEKAMTKRSQEEVNKRVVRWEREVSQALDLAAGFKNKAEGLERELSSSKEEMTLKLQESEERFADAEHLIKLKDKDIALLQEKLDATLHELHQERKSSEDTKVEVARLEGSNNRMEAELLVIREQRDLLAMRLKEETSRIKLLEHQKMSLESAVSESAVREKEANESCNSAKKHLESVKSELKSLYQSQLESVVREKLAEFQSQLETARDDMRHQLDSELATARESSRRHQQSLVNSHVAEMRRLESIHKEEMTSLERRLAEAESRCAKLELAKRDVAHKLHKVMENQWQQALGIITGELSMRQAESNFDHGMHHNLRADDLSQTLDQESPCKEIPMQSNPPQDSNQNQLLKYIEMMLDKHPGRPVDTFDSSILHDSSDMLDESNLPLNWNNRLRPVGQGNEGDKDGRKPPWK